MTRWGAVVALVTVLGCKTTDSPTTLVVDVGSDLAHPEKIDEIKILVDGALKFTFDLGAGSRANLPVRAALVAGGEKDHQLEIEAVGLRQGKTVVSQVATERFVPSTVRHLVLFLGEACTGVPSCPAGDTCENRNCLAKSGVGRRGAYPLGPDGRDAGYQAGLDAKDADAGDSSDARASDEPRSMPDLAADSNSPASDRPIQVDLVDAPSARPDGSRGNDTAGAGDMGMACPTMDDCTFGARRCGSMGGVETCAKDARGCNRWGAETTCPGLQTCQGTEPAADCACPARPAACTAGQGTFCESQTTLGTCVADAQGCVSIASRTPCPSGKPCTGAHPRASCSCPTPPAECAAGAGLSCQGANLVTCGVDSNGCIVVTSSTPCPSARPCAGVAPNAACTCPAPPAACAMGAGTSCQGNTLVACGNDANGCLAVTSMSACPAGKPCAGTSPTAACTCAAPPAGCMSAAGSFCETPSSLATCARNGDGCLVVTGSMSCTSGCMGAHPAAKCCVPACTGKCGGPDGCNGVCPNNCALPQTCGGAGTAFVCGCTPNCAGKCGGPDGCNGSCPNNCTLPQTCGGGGTAFVCGLPCGVAEVYTGYHRTCARKTDGTLWCWGRNDYGQVGDGTMSDARPSPVPITSLGKSVVQVAMGGFHTCALTAEGSLWCWGRNDFGTLGDNSTVGPKLMPAPVVTLGTDVAQVAAGLHHTCAVRKSDGTVWCWGYNGSGQVGNGTTDTPKLVPIPVVDLGTSVAQVSQAAGQHTCARKTNGDLWCWGYNRFGQVGDGTAVDPRPSPLRVFAIGSSVAQASTGTASTCALKTGGTLWCWGNIYTILNGDPVSVTQLPPLPITSLGASVAQVADGSSHTCARMMDGALYCWGYNSDGQVGDGTTDNPKYSPVWVMSLGKSVAQVATGESHTCALTTDGKLWCWGYNEYGQVGDGTRMTPRPSPGKTLLCP